MIGTRTKGWIGVDIGTHTVKLAQLERRAGRLQLAEALIVRRRQAWPDAGAAEPPVADSAEELRAALALGSRFAGRDAAVAVTMSLCDVRAMNVTEGPDLERREAVERELAVLGNAGGGAREFDFWDLDFWTDKPPGAENVLAASMPQDWSHQIARDLSAARLSGQVLDALPFALARAVELSAPGCSQVPIAAVDWGFRRATLCIILHGRPVFVRCLRDAGFAGVVVALARSLSVSEEEAQKLLTDRGLPTAAADELEELRELIAEIAAQPLQAFANELNRTLTFLRQQRRSLVPQTAVLFGGGAAVRNIGTYLHDKVDIPLHPWTVPGLMAADYGTFPPLPLLGSAVALSALAWEQA